MATRSVSSHTTDAKVVRTQASHSHLLLSQRMWLLVLGAILLLSQMLVAQPYLPSASARQGQPTTEELSYIQKASQTYVVGTLVSGNVATATIRPNGETRHVPLQQGVLEAYGISKGRLAFSSRSGATQEDFSVMDVATGKPEVVLTADRILRASWRPGHSVIAIAYQQANATHVAVYDIEAHSLRQVESLQSERPFLFWSRDGKTLNYVTSGSGHAKAQSYDASLNTRTVASANPESSTSQLAKPMVTGPVDSYTFLYTDGSTDPTDYRTPLILIHGIEGGAVSWQNGVQTATTNTWDNFLDYFSQGCNPLTNQGCDLENTYRIYEFIYQSDLYSVYDLAGSLRNQIDAAVSAHLMPDGPVVLMAHSMGGLIARAYMTEYKTNQGASNYTGQLAGERVLKLITLGTPHHGTPIASGPSRDTLLNNADALVQFLPDAAWIDVAHLMENAGTIAGLTTVYNVPNRDDLWWDNSDNAMSGTNDDSHPFIIGLLNSNTTYDGKISAFYGYYDSTLDSDYEAAVSNVYGWPPSAQRLPYINNQTLSIGVIMANGLEDVSGNNLYPRTDGFVPDVSAYFKNHSLAEVVECPGYNHVELHDGRADYLPCNATGTFKSNNVLDAIHNRLTAIRPFAVDTPASMVSPINNSILSGSSATFQWNLGSGVAEVQLSVGTSPGQTDIFTAWEGIHTSQTVSGLPTNGQPVYVTLQSKIQGQLQSAPYTYTASGTAGTYILRVNSSNPSSGVGISSSLTDNNGSSSGTTSFALTYNQNAQVTLTAPSTAGGDYFLSWTGCDPGSGTTTTCTVTMTTSKSVMANYAASGTTTYTLTVNSSNPSSGVGIAANPADNSGSSNGTTRFALTYNQNAQVTLTAPPNAGGNTFSSWTGCDPSSGATVTCTVTMAETKAVTANYVTTGIPTPIPLPVTISPNGTVTFACPSGYTVIGYESFKGTYPDTSTHVSTNTLGPSLVCSIVGAGYGTMENGYLNGQVPTADGNYWVRISKNGTAYVNTDFSGEWYYWTAQRIAGVWSIGNGPSTGGGDFGTVAIGQTSAAIPVTVTITDGGSIGGMIALTQGSAGLDFAVASAGTCATGTYYSAGATCTMNVTFTPKFAGLRYGVVVLKDGSGNTIATANLHGTGSGPQVAFSPGLISTVAGNGTQGYNGDGIAATSAELSYPGGIALDGEGNIFIADFENNRIRKVSASTGLISTVAGNGTQGYSGDGVPATSAELYLPDGVAVDSAGNVYIADDYNCRIRKVSASTGLITTVAGNGICGYNGDGILATSALIVPSNVAVDSAGNIYTSGDGRVRKVNASTGLISTVAGTGIQGYNGDGILATNAELNIPTSVAVDNAGNIFIADFENNRIRKVSARTGLISTVAGNGTGGYNGDGIAATSAELYNPIGVASDSAGNIYIVDGNDSRVREVSASTGLISTVTTGGGGGGGVAVDGAGNIYIELGNNIGKIDVSDAPSLSFVTTAVGLMSGDSPQTVTVQNNGNAPLNISQIRSSTNFSLGSSGSACSSAGQTLAPAASCTLSIAFSPTTSGSISGSIVLTDNSLNAIATTQIITLQGTGTGTVLQSQTITFPNPGTQSYGTAPIVLGATASSMLPVGYSVISGPANVSGSTLTITGVGAVTVQATQAGNTNYTAATPVNVTFTAIQGKPTVQWATPSPITYGTALSSAQLNATASVPGTFAYAPAAGTVLGADTQTLSVTFTPTDTTDYTTATATTSLTVNRYATTTTTSVPSSVTLGASVKLTATVIPASATGSVTFKNGGTTLGTATLSGGTASLTLAATTTSGFALGSNSITAVYGGDSNDSGSTSSAATLAVTESTSTAVTASPSSIALGSSSATQSLTATVTTTSGTPTGTVTFKVGTVSVGSAPLNSGSATLSGISPTTANGFTVGSDTITATYNPASGSGFIASTGTQTLTVTAPAYTITPSGTSVPLSKGGSQSLTVALASTTFADNTTWTATTSSPLITVSPSSGTATLSANGSSTVNLTITASSSAANHAPRLPWTGGLIMFGTVLAGIPLVRRRKRVALVLLTALAFSALGFMMSCGGGGGSSSTPPASPRSYTVTISGTGGVSSTITVTVQ